MLMSGCLSISARTQFNNLALFDVFSIDHETYQCPYFMPAMFSGCAGIHMKAIQFIIIHHFQNMRMPADERVADGVAGSIALRQDYI
jgi:hypothetical protein